jgi:hypothetical protein
MTAGLGKERLRVRVGNVNALASATFQFGTTMSPVQSFRPDRLH